MKKLISLTLAICVIATMLCGVMTVNASNTTDVHMIFVSPNGQASGDGSKDSPFATIKQAVEKAKNLNGEKIINLRGGEYQISESITLNADYKHLTIRAYPGEKVSLNGGINIPFSELKHISDDIKNRIIDTDAKDKVKVVNLKEDPYNIANVGGMEIQGFNTKSTGFHSTLSYNDQYLPIAQYPNDGFLIIDNSKYIYNSKSDGEKTAYIKGADSTDTAHYYAEYYLADFDRYSYWEAANDIWAFAYLGNEWADSTTPAEIDDNGKIKSYYINYVATAGRRVKFLNLLEEIDMAGEWYLDKDTGNLYVYEPEIASGNLYFTSYNDTFFNINNASNITISGIKFSGTRANAISVKNSDYITMDNCEFTNIGNAPVLFDKCNYSKLTNSHLHDLSSNAVIFKNCGNKETLTQSNNLVQNCDIHSYGKYRKTDAPGILMDKVIGATVSNNKIYDAPHMAIQYVGNDIQILNNEIYDVCQETSDAGVIYTGRYYDTKGNVIKHNYIHGTTKTGGLEHTVSGVYLDDCHSSTEVTENLFYNVETAVHIGGGNDNQFTNNVMLESQSKNISYDNRGMTWNADSPSLKNAVGQALIQSNPEYWITETWIEKYPELIEFLADIMHAGYEDGKFSIDYSNFVRYKYGNKQEFASEANKEGNFNALFNSLVENNFKKFTENGEEKDFINGETSVEIAENAGIPKRAVIKNNYYSAASDNINRDVIDNAAEYEGSKKLTNIDTYFTTDDTGKPTGFTDEGKSFFTKNGFSEDFDISKMGLLSDSGVNCNITFDISGATGGTATVNALNLTGEMEKGWADIEIKAPADYMIKSVQFGDTQLFNYTSGEPTVNFNQTIKVTADSTLKVVFEEIPEIAPTVTIPNAPEKPLYHEYEKKIEVTEGNTVIPVSVYTLHNSILAYGKLPYYSSHYEVTEIGCILAKDGKEIELPVEVQTVIKADGTFGLRTFGAAFTPGEYTLTPYVKYTHDNSKETTKCAVTNISIE